MAQLHRGQSHATLGHWPVVSLDQAATWRDFLLGQLQDETDTHLALRLGVDTSVLSRWLHGVIPSKDKAYLLAPRLGVSHKDLERFLAPQRPGRRGTR